MTPTPPADEADANAFDELGSTLNRVIDLAGGAGTSDLIDEVSELLWLVSSLDPEAERLLRTSRYVEDVLATSNDQTATPGVAHPAGPGGSDADH